MFVWKRPKINEKEAESGPHIKFLYPLLDSVEFSEHDLNVCEDKHVADNQKFYILPDGLRR